MPRTRSSGSTDELRALTLVVSPYHFCTREPTVYGALMLASHVVTLLPVPHFGQGGAESAQSTGELLAAVERVPRLLRLLESWRWSSALWRAGLVGSGGVAVPDTPTQRDEPEANLREALRTLSQQNVEDRGPLRPGLVDDEERFLDGLCGDLLKAGPDPAYCVPVAACLDRFAARHGFVVARGAGRSVSQRLEKRLGEKLFSFMLPVPRDVSGGVILRLRAALEQPLAALREELKRALTVEALAGPRRGEGVQRQAELLRRAYDRLKPEFANRDDDDGHRFRDCYLGVSVVRMPVEAVMAASRAAMVATGGSGRRAGAEAVYAMEPEKAQVSPGVVSLLFREMTAQPVDLLEAEQTAEVIGRKGRH